MDGERRTGRRDPGFAPVTAEPSVVTESSGTKPEARKPGGHRAQEKLIRASVSSLVILAGILVTLPTVVLVRKAPGVFYSRAQVRFVAPASALNRNGLNISPRSIVMTAGVVAKAVDPVVRPRASDLNATIVGLGVRDGWSVVLPNPGGQWIVQYDQPWLDVQVAGPTEAGVRAKMNDLVGRIRAVLLVLEQDAGTSPADLIRTKVSPADNVPVYYLHGSRSRATVGVLILGIGITSSLVALARRIRRPPVSARLSGPEKTEPDVRQLVAV